MTLIIIFLLFTSSIFSAPVTIPQGVSSKWVASYLHEQELIDNPTSFYLYLRLKKLDSKLHSGNFDIPNDSSFSEIANILTGKTLQMISVTIPEGYSLSEISRTLYDNGVISNETEFLNYVLKKAKDDFSSFQFIEDIPTSNLEGYFFPDTYYFSKNSSYKTIARSFFKRFKQVVIPEFKKLNTSNMSLHDVITLASIIEKEAGTIHEMDIISGVFHNRLRKKCFSHLAQLSATLWDSLERSHLPIKTLNISLRTIHIKIRVYHRPRSLFLANVRSLPL